MCGSFTVGGKAETIPGSKIQALELPGFFAGLKKYLQTKTDSQEGNTTLNGVD